MSWRLTIRSGPRVERNRYGQLDHALRALEERGRQVAAATPGRGVDTKLKRFEPADQVVARLELAGPQRLIPDTRAGLDVRGDGSVQAYRGRVHRELIEPRDDETAYAALRRVLTE